MLLGIAVLVLCLLAILMAITTFGKVAIIVIAGIAAVFAIAYLLGYGPAVGRRPTSYS